MYCLSTLSLGLSLGRSYVGWRLIIKLITTMMNQSSKGRIDTRQSLPIYSPYLHYDRLLDIGVLGPESSPCSFMCPFIYTDIYWFYETIFVGSLRLGSFCPSKLTPTKTRLRHKSIIQYCSVLFIYNGLDIAEGPCSGPHTLVPILWSNFCDAG